ncbi:nuclear transport factor 2 family protein [Bifidobacterium phasiani]|uniref:Nuclear transport factor 2 family protein n=1 Tax=Bifidobacterium phasiani TaxID=2834431 RepID=A0ABS6WB97_9BIFI|nr:nuclear transport factor 2 family protein [Bifidobacterium phasiani]MBW3083354.1 nuclear transport factor 2 family protein [Bifidobacterium phasiani]
MTDLSDDATYLMLGDAMVKAMTAADAGALREICDDGYTLTHMTGRVQSAAEWIGDVASGAMACHHVDVVSADVARDGDTGAPTLVMRLRVKATIWGVRGTWNLRLDSTFRERNGSVRFAETVAGTW